MKLNHRTDRAAGVDRSADANLKPFCRVDASTLHCLILRLAF